MKKLAPVVLALALLLVGVFPTGEAGAVVLPAEESPAEILTQIDGYSHVAIRRTAIDTVWFQALSHDGEYLSASLRLADGVLVGVEEREAGLRVRAFGQNATRFFNDGNQPISIVPCDMQRACWFRDASGSDRLYRVDRADDGRLTLEIYDDGPGVHAERLVAAPP